MAEISEQANSTVGLADRHALPFLSTGLVADLLGVPVHRLDYLTRDRQLRPRKGHTGAFMWSLDDARAAARRLELPEPDGQAFHDVAVGAIP